jgi:hypothetical protein
MRGSQNYKSIILLSPFCTTNIHLFNGPFVCRFLFCPILLTASMTKIIELFWILHICICKLIWEEEQKPITTLIVSQSITNRPHFILAQLQSTLSTQRHYSPQCAVSHLFSFSFSNSFTSHHYMLLQWNRKGNPSPRRADAHFKEWRGTIHIQIVFY